ncbi:DNA-3-methyladenine glycosylase I [Candidatus Dojkabacteria bacterium]|uniref:DNA-3-methyladenine glycosylase I n=1 Tax=Candidatus Dojkabacteria bacterium TaxID=2099670 RepID=A0A955L1K1_9BACT|nr:DNA-3-methyladenine glycosylase I [Candidatus Dojkabacteria bacterium]
MYRCKWAQNSFPAYEKYHDEEWGVKVHDDKTHFEFLILEGAQAGLSWSTIIKRKEGYRKAFANFDVKKVAKFGEKDFERLIQDEGIIRNKLKIRAAITNAQIFLEIQKEFGSFDKYIWQFVNGKTIDHKWNGVDYLPTTTKESDELSKDLKKRGMKFVGSTIMYAHMQACGLFNDHEVECFRHNECQV